MYYEDMRPYVQESFIEDRRQLRGPESKVITMTIPPLNTAAVFQARRILMQNANELIYKTNTSFQSLHKSYQPTI
jgi:hypothetical protein